MDGINMKNKELSCSTGLCPNVIGKEVFEREMALCKQLSSTSGKCGWGECERCGVIPLLYKLHKGILLEDPDAIREIKKKDLT